MPPPTLGVILAGGRARRMGGGDKPLIRLGGRTLLEHVAERLAPQCAAGLILSANGDPARFSGFPGPVVADGVPGQPGPLAGILAALDVAAARARGRTGTGTIGLAGDCDVVSVSGDTPFLPFDLVARLHAARTAAGAPLAVAASGERRHFTAGLWSCGLREDLRTALVARGERRVGAFIERHGAAVAVWPVDPVDPFLNVNAPEDLAAAGAALARLHRPAR